MPNLAAPDGLSLHYAIEGDGPPLILQTGGAGDGTMWHQQSRPRDREDPFGWNVRAASLMGDATAITLPGEDHMTTYVRTDLVVPRALEFLRARVS